jgi:PST family polysaccharide transporter
MRQLPPTAWATVTQVFAQAFGLLVFAVLAPILGPHAFGLVAMVLVFVGFWDSVPGGAATDALISIPRPDRAHYGSVTTLGAALGIAIGAGIYALAHPIAAALGDPELVPIMRAMAPLPFIQALAVAPTAAAQHTMRFHALTLRTVVSLVAGGLVGLLLALRGAGVWALVWQNLVQRSVAVAILWTHTNTGATVVVSRRHLRELAEFAMPNMVSRLMSWASGQVPRLILGLELGPTALGLFTMATRLNEVVAQIAILPKASVARVDLRRFAATPAKLGAAVRRVMLQISFIAFPISIGGSAIVPALFDTWLGANWHAAILPSQLMLLLGVPFTTIYVSAAVLLALKKQTWEAALCTIQSMATILGVAGVAPFGAGAAAGAVLACAIATVPLTVAAMRRPCGVPLRDIIQPQLPVLAAAGLMGLAVLALRQPLAHMFARAPALALQILCGGILYAILVSVLMPRTLRAAMTEIMGRFAATAARAP